MRALRLVQQAACYLTLFGGASVGLCQEFHNLDFELAQTAGYEPLSQGGPMSVLLPYWAAGIWGPADLAHYNFADLDIAQVGLYGGERRSSIFPEPIQGNYSAFLYAATENPVVSYPQASLFQTGLIPADARSLQFTTTRQPLFSGPTGTLTLTLDGRQFPYVPLESGPDYTTWGANVSSVAGTVAEMRFSLWADPPVRYNEPAIGLDSIQFSAMEIPEPGATALVGFWLFAAAASRLFRPQPGQIGLPGLLTCAFTGRRDFVSGSCQASLPRRQSCSSFANERACTSGCQ